MSINRRSFLKVLSAAGAGIGLANLPLYRAVAAPQMASDEYFILIHAAGAWDVTMGLDPRNTRQGLVEPGSTNTVDINPLRLWKNDDSPLDGGGYSYKPVRPDGNSPLVFGPGIGDLLKHYDRLTVINGIAMNTVSHLDGTTFSVTGRHLAGNKAIASSIDTMLADAMGTDQLMPAVSVNPYPSSYVGQNLDRRAVPLQIAGAGTLAASLRRSNAYDTPAQRDGVTALLSQEAQDLAAISSEPDVMHGMYLQFERLRRMMKENLIDAFTDSTLRSVYPNFKYPTMNAALTAAFAIELLKRNAVRCISFSYGSFDTHFGNYRQQPLLQQNLFDMISTMVDYLDTTPHPTKMGAMLSEHTHIVVSSDFCRTPQINVQGGRDHYPNNSSLVISPKFRGNTVYGKSDPEQLLPLPAGTFSDGARPVSPPDILTTFVSAFGIEPRKYLRDGEVVKELLAT